VEEDLEKKLRKAGARGRPVVLADDATWLVPTPHAEFALTDGRLVATPPRVSPSLLERIDRLLAIGVRDAEELLSEPACAALAFEIAYEALSINYELTPEVGEKLLDIHVLPDVLATVLGKKKL